MASKLAPYLSYADATTAIAWLEAIGFNVVAASVRFNNEDGVAAPGGSDLLIN
ncbi:hypothetical protein [Arthrobacter sp. FB24]|jgi:hypothetical protein|uniref:hypothetical protein n=1 Tax=Arthrobacter sp. (strain FB24) TaxID=290399 RepID=UPI0002D98FF2|nr:hypothetical protein [Arthrobacter sp. FB24]